MSVAFHFAKKGRIVMTDTEIMLKDIGMVFRTNDGIGKADFEKAISKMAADAFASGSPSNTRKDVSESDIIQIYQSLIS